MDDSPDPEFLGMLAADYRGWSGERTWHTLDREQEAGEQMTALAADVHEFLR